MQVCTSPQTDNHASIPPFSFLQAGCPSSHPTNSVEALKVQSCLASEAQTIHVLLQWPELLAIAFDTCLPTLAWKCRSILILLAEISSSRKGVNSLPSSIFSQYHYLCQIKYAFCLCLFVCSIITFQNCCHNFFMKFSEVMLWHCWLYDKEGHPIYEQIAPTISRRTSLIRSNPWKLGMLNKNKVVMVLDLDTWLFNPL